MEARRNETQPLLKSKKKGYLSSCFFIGHKASLLILLWAIISSLYPSIPIQLITAASKDTKLLLLAILTGIHGGILLLYPLFGWIADVCVKRYSVVGCSLYLLLASSVLSIVATVFILIYTDSKGDPVDLSSFPAVATSCISIGISTAIAMLGRGLFQANAIQFGCSQMLEASSEQLSGFIHWYYWSSQIGSILIYYTSTAVSLIFDKTLQLNTSNASNMNYIGEEVEDKGSELEKSFEQGFEKSFYYVTVCIGVVQCAAALIGIVTVHVSKKHLNIEHNTKHNPIGTVYRVLKYACRHKYPVNRSAFTYWEDKTPSRIDVGKDKYGGPFTTEEVEDTKTFLRISVLLMSLFGLHLTTHNTRGIASVLYHNCTENEKDLRNIIIRADTSHLRCLTILILVPAYQLIIKPCCLKNRRLKMSRRIFLGLIFALLSAILATAITALLEYKSDLSTRSHCNTFSYYLIAPQVLNGIANVLVFLTALEFILAQAPCTMQGLLIGLWYMMDVLDEGIREAEIVTTRKEEPNKTLVFLHCGRLGMVLASIFAYMIAAHFYKYRDRDNIVNSYQLVTDKIERTIAHNEREYVDFSTNSEYSINSDGSSQRKRYSGGHVIVAATFVDN
uniref:Major facilitator superfamily associated domain-containing protein n=1 Tax=Amphimedon queenslandica TaxID=400682 RepID=A0A1X7VMA7_AMPQE